MRLRRPRYPAKEIAERGQRIYEEKIRTTLRPEDHGRIVAIDIESADYAIADSSRAASQVLIERNPDAQIWELRVGYRAVHRIGAASSQA
jgi:ribosomal protein L16/L10AE